jgi:hypothetical protein
MGKRTRYPKLFGTNRHQILFLVQKFRQTNCKEENNFY